MDAALRGYQEQMLDNDFPYRNWSPPLVQRLWVPPRITGGVFIPGHMDDVIVKPGAWKREFSAPLSTHQPLEPDAGPIPATEWWVRPIDGHPMG